MSSPPDADSDELRKVVASAGFSVADHLLGSAPAVDFGPVVAAVVEAGERVDVASAQTRAGVRSSETSSFRSLIASAERTPRRVRSRCGRRSAATGGTNGVRGTTPAMARAHATAARVAVRAGESRLLGDQLRKASRSSNASRKWPAACERRFFRARCRKSAAARFHVCFRPRSRSGGDFHNVQRLDEQHVGFFVGDVVGTGAAAGGLLGVFVQQPVVTKEIAESHYRIRSISRSTHVSESAVARTGADDLPLVAMLVGMLNAKTGAVTPAAVGSRQQQWHVPANGTPGMWAVPGPFLGSADTTYHPLNGTLAPEIGC